MSYQEPEWAVKPSQGAWYLTEIKGGMEVGKHRLDKRATTIFGRATDMVHIPLNHESASRQHARISFDSQGIPWLRDLKSTHGTACNKRPLPPQAIGKIESNSQKAGSRGIILYPGDILRFGASTRMFCLEGPPEFDRGAMKARMQQAATVKSNTQYTTTKTSQPKPQEESISWGISMEDEVDENTTTSANKTLPMDMQVPDKYRKAFDRLNTLKYKLSNIQTEDDRIRRKGELSQGQEKQLQRNAEREENLKRNIIELEEELYDKIYPEKAGTKKKESNLHQNLGGEDDDDFFDRTQQKDESIINSEESEKSLISKWEKLYQQKRHQETSSIPQAKSKVDSLRQRLVTLEARGDEEAFFVSNDLSLAKEALDKLYGEQQRALRNMDEIEKLLKVVNPKIKMDRHSGYIGEGIPKAPPIDEKVTPLEDLTKKMMPPPVMLPPSLGTKEANRTSEDFIMPPPMMRKPSLTETKKEREEGIMAPPMRPPKRKRVVGPSMPQPQATGKGTLAFLSSMTKPSNSDKPSPDKLPIKDEMTSAPDSKKDVWRAPEGQDGSGITKLNAKFAGRY